VAEHQDAPADRRTDGPDGADEAAGPAGPDASTLASAVVDVERSLLGEAPTLTTTQVAERAGVPRDTSVELWRLMGFAQAGDDEVAFTEADVVALRQAQDLIDLGILSPERQAALVRTWGRSFARLAEWQTSLLASVALESAQETGGDPTDVLPGLAEEVLPRVEALQAYVWRRHLATAGARLMSVPDPAATARPQSVCFVDIVGYTTRSRSLSETELVDWLEGFESRTLDLVVAAGGRIIKNIGDEVLLVCDDPAAALSVALEMVRLGADDDADFPAVRAGIAHGDVVNRLGDVFGPTVNVAARLTSVAHPGTVLIDRGAHDALHGEHDDDAPGGDRDGDDTAAYSLKRLRRVSVKGYSRLQAWRVRAR